MPQAPSAQSQIKSIRLNSQALAKLAQRTAVVVACLLAIPDSFALIPGSSDPLDWALRVLMIWISALVLWYVSFLAVVNIVGAINDEITIDGQGIKFWRFGTKILWQDVEGMVCEEQSFFSRLFAFTPPACRIILLRRAKLPFAGSTLACQEIPSFLYSQNDFKQIFNSISREAFQQMPDGQNVCLSRNGNLNAFKQVLIKRRKLHLLLTIIIALGLVMQLGRKTAVNYIYASANKEFKEGHYLQAKDLYEKDTKLDPFFAVGWSNLAGTEFRLGDQNQAEKHWQLALKLKPDFVEAKVNLAYLALKRRDFGMAEDMLQRALRLSPWNKEALINMAELNMRRGRVPDAIRYARKALTVDPQAPLATCLIAQGRLRLGYPEEALKFLLSQKEKIPAEAHEEFCYLVEGEIQLALGYQNIARDLFAKVVASDPKNADALIDLARVYTKGKDYVKANELLEQAAQLLPQSPCPLLCQADCAVAQGRVRTANILLLQACQMESQDAASLAFAARLANELGKPERALELAKRSLSIEPVNNEALAELKTAASHQRKRM